MCGARSTDHLPDSYSSNAQSILTSSFLQHHHPAAQQQQQQWAHLARTAAIKLDLSEISIDHLTTPRPHHFTPLSLLLLLHIAVCNPTLPLLHLCSAQSVHQPRVLHCPRKKSDIAKSPDNKANGSTSVCRRFLVRTFRFSALAPNVSMEPKFASPDMSSLVHSRECAKATALFVSSFIPDLVAEG